MKSRKPPASTRPLSKLPGNGCSAAPRAFVEFHPSMSLENVPTLADCLSVSSEAVPTFSAKTQSLSVPDAEDATLENVLANRLHVWTKVAEVIDKLGPAEAYQGDVHALQKLLQLHLLCKQRETHLRTLQLTLLQEGRRVEASTITETKNEDDTDAIDDVPDVNEVEWNEEQQRRIDIIDYDAIDLIELSEQFP